MTRYALARLIFWWLITQHPVATHDATAYQWNQDLGWYIAIVAKEPEAKALGDTKHAAALLTAWVVYTKLDGPGVQNAQSIRSLMREMAHNVSMCRGAPESWRLAPMFGGQSCCYGFFTEAHYQ